MAIKCPICENGTIKKTDTQVYCSLKKWNSKLKKNEGCDFHIFFDQKKLYGDILDVADVKKLLNGDVLTSQKNNTIKLDLDSKHFTKIEFAEKEEDEDL